MATDIHSLTLVIAQQQRAQFVLAHSISMTNKFGGIALSFHVLLFFGIWLVKGEIVYKVICPDEDHLRTAITTRAIGENFRVVCSNPGGPWAKSLGMIIHF